jgi:signal transduction histidine kinase
MGIVLFVVAVPWTAFTLRYVGRGRLVTRRRVALGGLLLAGYLTVEFAGSLDLLGLAASQRQSLRVAASVVALASIAVIFAACWLVLASTSRHDRLSWVDGTLAVLPVLIPMLTFQVTRPSTPGFNDVVTAGAFVAVAGTLWVSTTRYDVLSDRPGTRTLGERAAVAEMDEAVFVVDRMGRLAGANPAATSAFGATDDSVRLREVIGLGIEELVDRETVECRTTRGLRQFDPRVTELRNGHGERLGYTLALFDVTDREIRRQRLQVLNRILRHNLRNRLDVIRAHAEEASNAPIIENADRLDHLSTEARRIETLMERAGAGEATTHLPTVVEAVVTATTESFPDAEATVAVPDVTLQLDRGLCRYALEQLVENALEHNDAQHPHVEVSGRETATGIRLVVADNGPGIPAAERDVITAESEHDLAHGSSLGLWGANWAVQTLGGDLDFDSSDNGGTAVLIDLPGSS